MQKYKNRIFGVIIICFLAFFVCFNAFAEEQKEEKNNAPQVSDVDPECQAEDQLDIQDRYNLQLEKIGPQQYKIVMAGEAEDLDGAQFKVIGIGEYKIDAQTTVPGGSIKGDVNSIAHIAKNQSANFNAIPQSIADGQETVLAVKVQLVKGTTNFVTDCEYYETVIYRESGDTVESSIYDSEIENPNSKNVPGSICYNFYNGIWNEEQFVGIKKTDFENYNYLAVAGKSINGKSVQATYNDVLAYCLKDKISSSAQYTQTTLANMIGNTITYAKSRLKTAAGDQTFAELLEAAKTYGTNKSGINNPSASLKCDWQKTDTTSDYYVNKDYFYKTEIEEPQKATYTYHYAPGNTVSEEVNVCQRTCTEAVKLEYGPPVASKAGLCFEYKVKVTSYVECSSEILIEPPTEKTTYCSPSPWCHEKNWSWQGYNAGPTEDFDACIQECDGGKYTSKCSVKCYKKVYKNSKLNLAISYENLLAEKMSLSDELSRCLEESSDGGCYYWSGGSIYWKSTYQGDSAYSYDSKALGRWYRETGRSSLTINGKAYAVSSNGIRTRAYGNGSYCQDVCAWTNNCSKNTYLNPHSALADNDANFKSYQAAVAKCEATATCATTTANYTISINYDTKEKSGDTVSTVKKKVEFPYSSTSASNADPDKLTSLGEKDTDSGETGSTENTSSNANTTILSYDGCYKAGEEKNWYMTEWSFPGTYIHNKTGEISFGVPSDTSGWYYENKKFCMPLDAENVNTKWWEWYKVSLKKFKEDGGCYTASEIQTELNTADGTSNGYNITAEATSFGYYNWNFTVQCFYALRNEVCETDESNKCCKKKCTDEECPQTNINYVVRSVDRDNLFPNAKQAGVIDDTKRDIGFNWTTNARISELKNSAYSVDPEKLIKNIQDNANDLYNSDTNLDYQFYLTPSTLKKIRDYNRQTASAEGDGKKILKNPYATWNGTVEEKNGIMVYSSNLFRSTAETGAEKDIISEAVKKLGTIGVNNENYVEFGDDE